jgi:hypothetical protein
MQRESPSSPDSRRRQLWDLLRLTGLSVVIVVLGLASLIAAEAWHFDTTWILLGWLSAGFFVAIGWEYGREFKSIAFVSFFLTWLVLHALIFVVVLSYLSWLWYMAALAAELFAYYASASLLFGLEPPNRHVKRS